MTAALLALTGVTLMLSPAGAEDAGPAAGAITITQTPSGAAGPCVPAPLGLTRNVFSDDMVFRLTVIAAAPPCTPIEAKAVVYAMPGNGEQWPQTLVEVVPFTISEAGTTEVTFAKGCDPVQFDVLTGATPQVISPLGERHGPLLFPFDTSTSLQYFGDPACNPTTTVPNGPTTSTPDVNGSTTVPESSSTTQPEVEGISTVPSTVANQVLGSTQQPAQQPQQLALTGDGSTTAGLIGGCMVAAGLALLLVSRRRDPLDAPAEA